MMTKAMWSDHEAALESSSTTAVAQGGGLQLRLDDRGGHFSFLTGKELPKTASPVT